MLILKKEHKALGGFFAAFNRWFSAQLPTLCHGCDMDDSSACSLPALLFIGMVAVTVGLWKASSSLVPDEDQGYYISAVILPDGATLQRTDKVVQEVLQIMKSNPANQDVVAFLTGFDFLGGGFRNNAAPFL